MIENKDNKKGGTLHHRANRQAPSKGTEIQNNKNSYGCQIVDIVADSIPPLLEMIKKALMEAKGDLSEDTKLGIDLAFNCANKIPELIKTAEKEYLISKGVI